jgi:hypothetical protein
VRPSSPTSILWGSKFFLAGLVLFWVLFTFFKYFSPLANPFPLFDFIFNVDRFPKTGLSLMFLNWSGFLLKMTTGLWVTSLLWCVGRRFCRLIQLTIKNPVMVFCVYFGLGALFFNILWIGLGLAGLWYPVLWWAGALLFSGLLILELKLIQPENTLMSLKMPWPRGVGFFLFFFGLLCFMFLLAHALLPETFYDTLNYFLGMPHYWLFRHGICDYPTHLLSGYFQGGSFFLMNSYVFQGVEGAKVLNAFVFMFCAICAFGWVSEIASFKAAWVAFGVILTFPLLYLNSFAARVDGFMTFVSLLFFYTLIKAFEKTGKNTPWPWILVSGLFAGLSLSIKPTAVIGIIAAFIALLWVEGWGPLKKWKIWVLWGGLILFILGPWFLKNAAFTGNPFFPYAIHWFVGRSFSDSSYSRLLSENRQFLPMGRDLLSFLTVPWRLTMPQGEDRQFIGPLLLALGPILFFARFKGKPLKFLIRLTVCFFFLGLCMSHMLRFLMPAFVTLLMLLTIVLMEEKKKFWGALWLGAVCVSALFSTGNYIDLSARFFDGIGIWSGRETTQAYLERKLQNSYQPMVQWSDENLPADSRLLIVGDARGVYYKRPFYANSAFDDPFFAKAAAVEKTPGGILKELNRLGITHLAVNIPEGERISADYGQYHLNKSQWGCLNEFLRLGLEPLYFKDFLAVYRVKPELGESKEPYLVNPFSFFSPQAYDLKKDLASNDFSNAEKDADRVLALFPRDSFWLERKGFIYQAEGKNNQALKTFQKADQNGVLTMGGYRYWAQAAQSCGDLKSAQFALQRLKTVYPQSLGNR